MMTPRVLYLAHGPAGYQCLNLLIDKLYTQPENILGFSYQMKEDLPLVQRMAVLGIRYSLKKINSSDSLTLIEDFKPNLIISMHFRDIIPKLILDSAYFGGFNLHPSLLPKYRGCFSGPWAIINGEKETGISYHFLTSGIDEGNLILQKKISINSEETGYSIFNKLVDLGVNHFCEAFNLITTPGYSGAKQVGQPSYYRRRIPHDGVIDPNWSPEKIDAFIRALNFPNYRGAQLLTSSGMKEVLNYEGYQELLYKGCVKK
jgi:methionyl-tRNA formyltransferase